LVEEKGRRRRRRRVAVRFRELPVLVAYPLTTFGVPQVLIGS